MSAVWQARVKHAVDMQLILLDEKNDKIINKSQSLLLRRLSFSKEDRLANN